MFKRLHLAIIFVGLISSSLVHAAAALAAAPLPPPACIGAMPEIRNLLLPPLW
jgi:hypothetical protein